MNKKFNEKKADVISCIPLQCDRIMSMGHKLAFGKN